MGYVGREKLLPNGVFEKSRYLCLKEHLSRFYLARSLTIGVSSSTSPIEGNSLLCVTTLYIYAYNFRASWPKNSRESTTKKLKKTFLA